MANTPKTPNYKPGVGQLVTNRYDFENHIEGNSFRHNATQIDIANPSAAPGGATTVESALDVVATFIEGQSGSGQGFITVGDGYDTWHAANGNQNFDPSIPSLDTLLNPIFQSLSSSTPLPNGYERVQHGGIVVLKSGTYVVKKPIYIPAGITLLGEGYGTKVINATGLALSNAPILETPYAVGNSSNVSGSVQLIVTPAIPNIQTGDYINISNAGVSSGTWTVTVVSNNTLTTLILNNSVGSTFANFSSALVTTLAPVFIIQQDTNRTVNDVPVDANLFSFSQETRIFNMVICDNFVENAFIGDNNYKLPQSTTSTTYHNPPPLVQQTPGSSLVMDGVVIIGRALTTSGVVSSATGNAIALISQWAGTPSSYATVPAGSILKINDCFIDGFSIPVSFQGASGGYDYLEATNCKIRGYGYYNQDSADGFANCMFLINDSTSKITNNILYANNYNMTAYVFVNNTLSSAPALQARGKLTVSNNMFINNKVFSGDNSTSSINTIAFNATNVPSPSLYLSTLSFGNNLQDQFNIIVDGTPIFQANSSNLNISTNVNIASNLVATGTSTFTGSATFNGTTSFNQTAIFNNDVIYHVNGLSGSISATNYSSAPQSITVPQNTMSNGDLIYITGSNVGTDGLWVVTQVNSTTYSLNGSSSHAFVPIPTYGSFTIISHNVNSSDYMIMPPSYVDGYLASLPISVTAGVTTPELNQTAYCNGSSICTVSTATSSTQGPYYVGQYITIYDAQNYTNNNGTYKITAYTPAISGTGASIDVTSSGILQFAKLTVGSGTPFNSSMIGQLITISGSVYNSGAQTIGQYYSPTEIGWFTSSPNGEDPNNTNINWTISATFTYTNSSVPQSYDTVNSALDGAFIINLPPITNGRVVVIKDPGGASLTNSILIVAQSGNTFDASGLSTYTITNPVTSLTFVGYGTQWLTI